MEWAFVEAFDGSERDPLTLEQISTLDGDSRLSLQPHLQLIALEFPVDDLVLNLHKNEKRQTSEAGVATRGCGAGPAKLPPCGENQRGLQRIASTSRFIICA